MYQEPTLIARFMGPAWGPSGADRTQVGPMLAPWTLLSEKIKTWLSQSPWHELLFWCWYQQNNFIKRLLGYNIHDEFSRPTRNLCIGLYRFPTTGFCHHWVTHSKQQSYLMHGPMYSKGIILPWKRFNDESAERILYPWLCCNLILIYSITTQIWWLFQIKTLLCCC